jgi:hypothetical protein
VVLEWGKTVLELNLHKKIVRLDVSVYETFAVNIFDSGD